MARYRHKRANRPRAELFDRHDLLARLLMHIPAPRLHVVRYYGHYSSSVRARRRRDDEASEAETATVSQSPEEQAVSATQRRRLRRQWARMIRRVYEPAKARLISPARRWGVAKPASSLPPGGSAAVRLRGEDEGHLVPDRSEGRTEDPSSSRGESERDEVCARSARNGRSTAARFLIFPS
jgi:hypothetical protein